MVTLAEQLRWIEDELPRWRASYRDGTYTARAPTHADTGLAVDGPSPGEVVTRGRAVARVHEVARVMFGEEVGEALAPDRWPDTRRHLGVIGGLRRKLQDRKRPQKLHTGGVVRDDRPVSLGGCDRPVYDHRLGRFRCVVDIAPERDGVAYLPTVVEVHRPLDLPDRFVGAPAPPPVPPGGVESTCGECGSTMAMQAGTCAVCLDCGTPSGGCS